MSLSDEKKKDRISDNEREDYGITTMVDGVAVENADQLHRQLNNRQIQLIAIGGSIGTALFVSIGMILQRLLDLRQKWRQASANLISLLNRYWSCTWWSRELVPRISHLCLHARLGQQWHR